MISFLTEVVGIRDDIFLGEGHRFMSEVAASLEESVRKASLESGHDQASARRPAHPLRKLAGRCRRIADAVANSAVGNSPCHT